MANDEEWGQKYPASNRFTPWPLPTESEYTDEDSEDDDTDEIVDPDDYDVEEDDPA